ncbi:MAG TPA: PAS domain-containing sensor histidine kinase [Vicinamibacteria bacterium]|nr:PAS domain-containing sensor histidine kinase [Vicinamibacteria bacterium]
MSRGSGIGAEEEGLAHRLLDGVGRGLALLDAAGQIRLANRAAESLLGYGPGALVGCALADLYPAEQRRAGAPERALAAARGDGRVEDDGWRVRGDGSRVRAGFVVALLPPSAGDTESETGFTLELQEGAVPRELEAELRGRDELLATLSHELRTPLTAIMGWAHLLRKGDLDEATRARALEIIERNVRLQAQLTADILDVARILVTGKLRLHIQNVDATPIVESAVEAVRPQAQDKHVALRATMEGASAPVAADPDRLQQAVRNLLTNAVKFTAEGGEVDVRVTSNPQEVVIEVKDTGEGIEPEQLAHVFERFWPGRAAAQRKGGLGLGLAIVSHIVELHSGHVRASSEGPGRGSTFTLQLPRTATASPPLPDATVLVGADQEDARER